MNTERIARVVESLIEPFATSVESGSCVVSRPDYEPARAGGNGHEVGFSVAVDVGREKLVGGIVQLLVEPLAAPLQPVPASLAIQVTKRLGDGMAATKSALRSPLKSCSVLRRLVPIRLFRTVPALVDVLGAGPCAGWLLHASTIAARKTTQKTLRGLVIGRRRYISHSMKLHIGRPLWDSRLEIICGTSIGRELTCSGF